MSLLNKTTLSATYCHQYFVTPFRWKKFPMDHDRYAITIVCKNLKENKTLLINLLTYIYNCIENSDKIKKDYTILNAQYIKKILSDYSKTNDELKQKIAIIDYTSSKFLNTLENYDDYIIPFYNIETEKLPISLVNNDILRINIPNLLFPPSTNCDKNFSHCIWLTDKLSPILSSTSTTIFFLDSFIQFTNDNLHIENFQINEDQIYVFQKLVSKNGSIECINKKRFLC